ncbi:putative membrane protein [Pseudobutyrivibrio sp. ACV-2]|uniref:YhgE/Pip domain-containing protein n=1 Tax=Pseudobutyrivibrio sp. ACV-2 TaxID=1520801 RepID=UPI000896AF5D|nr:YhgE/Pip domain-containing protein [Pseudobutyrivibrio sp. ACV-2]SEA86000.1 putative membrane protein [Pseudobutyrivibrio sp. ACV-2]
MKNIWKIFVDDILSLVKNFFALVIVIGICFLPALYAWFNIYSNWDPYGNTGALKLAAVSVDKGYTDENGEYHNQGDSIIENLHENTAIDWQFVDNSDEAIEGVYSGKYYAAVVVDEDFSYNMYNAFTDEIRRPTLHFYENQKKNPVATKISDTVIQNLQNTINVTFTEVVVREVFKSANKVSEDIKEDDGLDGAILNLKHLREDLDGYQVTIGEIIENDAKLQQSLKAAKNDATNLQQEARNSANAARSSSIAAGQTETSLAEYSKNVNAALNEVNNSITEIEAFIGAGYISTDVKDMETYLQRSAKDAANIVNYLNILAASKVHGPILKRNLDRANELYAILQEYDIGEPTIAGNIVAHNEQQMKSTLEKAGGKVSELKSAYNDNLVAEVNNGLKELGGVLDDSNSLLNSAGDTFGSLKTMFTAINNTVDSANVSLQKTSEALSFVNNRIKSIIGDVDTVDNSDKIQALVNGLSGDPKVYGKFFSQPVEVKTEAVYPIENYGSAVAPFYSTLAFWVGALILTAIIKVHPDKKKYPDATKRQLYFGRYVLYWILGQLQAIIIVLGDLYLLHVQCVHPGLFMLAGSIIATTFTLLIYSFVITWGDVGKALAVVIVVIQIAGSSGTYPIELLPEFFKKVYIFFPFPYAINAIRECLCGMYGNDYIKYLCSLGIFIIVALVIGLLVRIPFEPINHYMEERMEDTEMM